MGGNVVARARRERGRARIKWTGAGVASPSIINTASNFLAPASVFITAPILARNLTVDERGVLAGGTAPYMLLVAVGALGLPEAVTYYTARNPESSHETLRSGLVLAFGAAVVFAILLDIVGPRTLGWLGQQAQTIVRISAAALIPSLVILSFRASAAGRGSWHLIALERLFTGLARIAMVVGVAVFSEMTPTTGSLGLLLSPLVGLLVYGQMLRRLRWRVGAAEPPVARRTLVSYSTRVWAGSIAGLLLMRLDQVLMAPLSSANQLGYYAIAVNVGEVPLIVNGALREVIFASDAGRNNNDRLEQVARLSGVACLVIAGGVAAISPWFIPLVFGRVYEASVGPTVIMLAAVAIGTPASIVAAGLGARGRPGVRSVALVGGAVINLVLLLLLVPHQGAMGAAWATLGGNLASSALSLTFGVRLIGVRFRNCVGLRSKDINLIRARFSAGG